jgi:hypothetical protein
VGRRKGRGLNDRRVREQHVIDFPGRDLLASPVDDFLQAARDKQIAILVQMPLVSGAEPALDERGRIGGRVVLVSMRYVRAANHYLAGLAGRQQAACLVHDCHPGTGGPAHRTRLSRMNFDPMVRHLGLRHG